jgi:hypothetical protein
MNAGKPATPTTASGHHRLAQSLAQRKRPGWRAMVWLVAIVFSAPASQAQHLNDTGQIICYNASAATGTVSPATPDPETAGFDEQDCTQGRSAADALSTLTKVGASTVPGRDYTKIANDGSALPASATLGSALGDWACTRDNVTGLIWEVKVNSASHLRHVGHTYSWYDTNPAINGGNAGTPGGIGCNGTLAQCNTTAFRDAVNAQTGANRLCGATDWHLPTANELQSLVHYGAAAGPYIDTVWFPLTANSVYWSGANYAPDASYAWNVNFYNGYLGADVKTLNLHVRLVRGGQ